MLKQELADRAGVTTKTLMRWCRPYKATLRQLGLTPNARLLPPNVVQWIANHFCIDV